MTRVPKGKYLISVKYLYLTVIKFYYTIIHLSIAGVLCNFPILLFSLIDILNRFDVEEEDADGLSESVDYLIMGYVKHTVPIRDQTHKLYLPHRFYPLNIFPRYSFEIMNDITIYFHIVL